MRGKDPDPAEGKPGLDARSARLQAEDRCELHVDSPVNEMRNMERSGLETVHSGPYGSLPILILSHDPEKTVGNSDKLLTGQRAEIRIRKQTANLGYQLTFGVSCGTPVHSFTKRNLADHPSQPDPPASALEHDTLARNPEYVPGDCVSK